VISNNVNNKAQNLAYGEGDWFAVPLDGGGYCVGVIARAPKDGKVLFGYFFGPKLREMPSLNHMSRFSPEKSVLITMFGDYSLYHGEWPVLGAQPHWSRASWRMPYFSRVDENGKAVKVEYSEDDPSICIRETPCSVEEAKKYPEDRMLGSHLVVRRLSKLLAD
jgi:hypothetical protein